ncbi:MAG: DUF192 domain-containing protein [Candidatus Aenigmarchaeota archaeon]|nr:DUF192 domain-containing protein [Candidatus Aenigmarchaeota archaeon]
MKGFMVIMVGLVVVATFLLLLVPYLSTRQTLQDSVTFVSATDGEERNNTVFVEIADEPEERRRGLMNRTSLGENSGMLFVFEGESVLYFWMKDTRIPLDMIFISGSRSGDNIAGGHSGEIASIKRNAQPCGGDPCETYGSIFPAKYVVEVNAGWADAHNVREGGTVVINYNRS